MRSRSAAIIAVITLALAGTVVSGGSVDAAEGHTTLVSPATGLSDGQTVTVTGTGWVEVPLFQGWIITQCSSAVGTNPDVGTALNECDAAVPGNAQVVQADAAGNIDSPFVVHKTFTTTAATPRTVTCGQAPNDCAILIAQFATGGTFTSQSVPISFGTPVPTLADCIRTFLGDHQHRPLVRWHRLLVCLVTALRAEHT